LYRLGILLTRIKEPPEDFDVGGAVIDGGKPGSIKAIIAKGGLNFRQGYRWHLIDFMRPA
jgi:hypothetical protein